ncbi:MAG: hypothetical protein WDW36_008655 [Sanguina aurantia]
MLSKFNELVIEGLQHLNASISVATPHHTLDAAAASPGLDAFSFFATNPAQRASAVDKLKLSLQNQTGIQLEKSAFSEAVAEWASRRAKLATTSAEAAFWSAPLIGKLLVLADAAKDAEQSVRDAYFAFWVQQSRSQLSGGGCTLSTVSLPLYGQLAVNCDNPGVSVRYAQPRYVNEYTGGASFRTEECKAQQKFGLEATVMIDLGKPFDGSSLTGTLGDTVFGTGGAFADTNTQGVPNLANPQFLKRFYDAFNSRLLQADVTVQQRQTPVEMVRAQVVDSLQALGLDQFAEVIEVKAAATAEPEVAAVGGSEFARLFPNIFSPERKAGALKDIFAGVLTNGLASTLYKERNAGGTLIQPTGSAGAGAGNSGGSNRTNGSSSSGGDVSGSSSGSSGSSSETVGSSTAAPTPTVFQGLAAEMERLLALREFIHEAPPTGHRVVKKNGATIYASDTDPLISLAATGAVTNTTSKTATRLGAKDITFTNAGAAAVASPHQATADTTAAAEASAAAVASVVEKLAASAALLGLKGLSSQNPSLVTSNAGNVTATAAAAAAAVVQAIQAIPLILQPTGSVGTGATQTGSPSHSGAADVTNAIEGPQATGGVQKEAGSSSSAPAAHVTKTVNPKTVLIPISSQEVHTAAGTAQAPSSVTGGLQPVSTNVTRAGSVALLEVGAVAAGNMHVPATQNDTRAIRNVTQLAQELKDAYASVPVKPKAP